MGASRAPAAPAQFTADIRSVTFQQLIDEGVLEIGDGYRAKNEELSLSGPGPIFLRAGHVTPTSIDFSGVERFVAAGGAQLSAKMSQPGDLVLTTKGASTGRTAFVTPELPRFVYSPHLSFWRSKAPEVIASGFLRYWASSVPFLVQLRAMQASTDMAAYMSLTDQRRLQIDLPSIEVQRAIAHVLGTLDNKIDLNRRTSETLEAMARALFKSWFVDFDPVHAKKAGRQPDGMNAETAALFPDNFCETDIGLIPRGWNCTDPYALATVEYGAPYASSLFNSNGTGRPIVRIRDLRQQEPTVWTLEVHPRDVVVHAGDILVGMDGEFRAHVWKGEPSVLNQRLCCFRPKCSWDRTYLRMALEPCLAFVERTEVATTVIHLGKADIDRFRLLLAPIQVRRAFAATTEAWTTAALHEAASTRTLTALRDALLPQLLSGALRVPEAMRRAEKAL